MIHKEELEFIQQNPKKKFSIKSIYDKSGADVETMKNVYLKVSQPRYDPLFPLQPVCIRAFDSDGVELETFVNASGLGREGASGFKMLLSVEPMQEEAVS